MGRNLKQDQAGGGGATLLLMADWVKGVKKAGRGTDVWIINANSMGAGPAPLSPFD